jgi:DNA end-binding protein Ku
MAPRAHWKGYLKLSLVSCPIALYSAIDASQRIAFRQINRATGHRLRHQLVDTVTGEVVESHDKARGYEVDDNEFVAVEDEELKKAREDARAATLSAIPDRAIVVSKPEARSHEEGERTPRRRAPEPIVEPPPAPRIENTRAIEIERFVPRAQIDPRCHHTPYYVAPRDVIGQEAFAVIRDAISGKDVVAMGRVVLSNRERPIILQAMGAGLLGMTLRYAHEIRAETDYFADIPNIKLPEEMLSVAEHIVEAKLADFDPAQLEDRYRAALVPILREKKSQARKRGTPATPSKKTVVNLMDVLKHSLTIEQPLTKKRAAAAAKSSSTKRTKVRPEPVNRKRRSALGL